MDKQSPKPSASQAEKFSPSTMKDIAERAGVSIMTVSRAIRSPHLLSEETLTRVRQAIEANGYVTNSLAGSHGFRRTATVAMVVPSLQNSLFASTVQAASETLGHHGFSLMLAASGWDSDEEERAISMFLAQRPAGLILHDTVHSERTLAMLRNAHLPIVETGDLIADPLDAVVSFSNQKAADVATTHLLDKGYTRIALVSLPLDVNARARARLQGYRAALKRRRIPYDEARVIQTPGGVVAGAKALLTVLESKPDTDAIFFAGDVGVIGAMLECQRRGWDVPARIAVAALDALENEVAQFLSPVLTSVQVPRADIGRFAAQTIVSRCKGEAVASRVDVGFRLIEGQSS